MIKRILYISSVPLEDKMGGSVVMYHHLKQNNDFEVLEVNNSILHDAYYSFYRQLLNAFWHRISRTRWRRWAIGYEQLWRYCSLPDDLDNNIGKFNPDIVLTVAHGNLFWLAQSVAHRLKLPLVSIYHDWWPVLLQQNQLLKPSDLLVVNKRFQQLYVKSDCVFCISEGMCEALGVHPNAHILYPAANHQLEPIQNADSFDPAGFKLLYSGNVVASYGQRLRSLIHTQPLDSTCKLSIHGIPHDWAESELFQARQKEILKPFIPTWQFTKILSQASALLTVVSFDRDVSQLMRTNFPSKLATYAAFGKPLVVWAPADSTAAQFVRKHECGLLIEDPDPRAVWRAVFELSQNLQKQQQLSKKALQLHYGVLNPKNIHKSFVQQIQNLSNKERDNAQSFAI